MVIGKGSIAQLFTDKFSEGSEVIIFASGVSNSNEINDEEFVKEKKLIIETISKYPNSKIIYFSSIFSEYVDNAYYRHKKDIEIIITEKSNNYLIIRLPQVVSSSGNANNLVNFFIKSIKENNKVKIQKNTERALIDVQDVKNISYELIKNYNQKIFNFSYVERVNVYEIYRIICNILSVELNFEFVPPVFNTPLIENNSEISDLITKKIDKKNYTYKILKKYVK